MSIGLASTASTGWAGTFGNRDDVVDIDNSMLADSVDSPVVNNRAFMELEASTAFASGSVNNNGNSTTFTGIQWFAFEPDQAKRSTNGTGGSIQQKDQLFLEIFVHGFAPVFQGIVPGCKAKISAKAPKGSVLSSTVSQGTWSVNCNKKAGDTVALTADQLAALQLDLGKKVVGKNSLTIKGKCTDANCND